MTETISTVVKKRSTTISNIKHHKILTPLVGRRCFETKRKQYHLWLLNTIHVESAKPDPDVNLRAVSAYGNVPVAVLGRLAVDLGFQKRGLSQDLIAHAITGAKKSITPTVALVVDSLKPELVPYYKRLGVIRFTQEPLRLVLPFPKRHF